MHQVYANKFDTVDLILPSEVGYWFTCICLYHVYSTSAGIVLVRALALFLFEICGWFFRSMRYEASGTAVVPVPL